MPAKPNPLERCEPPRGERSSRYDPPGSSSLGASLYPRLGTFTYPLTLAAPHGETHLRLTPRAATYHQVPARNVGSSHRRSQSL